MEYVIDLEERVPLKESNGRMDNKTPKGSFKEKADFENMTGDKEDVEVRTVVFQIKCTGMSNTFSFRVMSDASSFLCSSILVYTEKNIFLCFDPPPTHSFNSFML